MKTRKSTTMLLTVDGSKRARITIRNIAEYDPFLNTAIRLFHVFNAVPASYWDVEKTPKSSKSIEQVKAWETQQRREIEKQLRKQKKIFTGRGFDEKQIVIDIHDRVDGVARDILKEAEKDYDMVVTRRRGAGMVPGVSIGGVAAKLIEGLSFTPVIISGRMRPNPRVLVAVDGSESSYRALGFIGRLLAGHGVQIDLLHVIRSGEESAGTAPHLFAPEAFLERAVAEAGRLLATARERLCEQGCRFRQIRALPIVNAKSRAAAIAAQARAGDYHLLVLGRRGLSQTIGFSMGTVTRKTVQLVKESTICVVP